MRVWRFMRMSLRRSWIRQVEGIERWGRSWFVGGRGWTWKSIERGVLGDVLLGYHYIRVGHLFFLVEISSRKLSV